MRMSNFAGRAWAAAFFLAAALPAGCTTGPTTDVPRKYRPYGTLAILPLVQRDLPFRALDPRNRHGAAIAELARGALAEELAREGTTLLDPRALQQRLQSRDTEGEPLADLAKAAGCDWLVIGTIDQFSLRDPRAVNMFRGRANLRVTVFEAKTGRAIPHTLEARFPQEDFGGYQTPGLEMEEEGVRDRLIAACARQLAWLFLDHEERRTWR